MGATILFLWLPLLCYLTLVTAAPSVCVDRTPMDSKIKKGITFNVTENCLSSRHLTVEQIESSHFDMGESTCVELFEDFDCSNDAFVFTGEFAKKHFLNLKYCSSVRTCKKTQMETKCSSGPSQEYNMGFSTTGLESFTIMSGECKEVPWTKSQNFRMVADTLQDGSCIQFFSTADCSQSKIQLTPQFIGVVGFAPHDVQSMQICKCFGESMKVVEVVEAEHGEAVDTGAGDLKTFADNNVFATERNNEVYESIPEEQGNPKRR